MSNPTISNETTALGFVNYAVGSVAKMRIYANQPFRTADNQFVPQGSPGDLRSAFLELNLTVGADKSLSIPSTDKIPFTSNSSRPTATFTAIISDAQDGHRMTFLERFTVPAHLGSSFTWTQLEAAQGKRLANPPFTTLTREQILDIIADWVASGNAPKMTTTVDGIGTLFEAAVNSAAPKVLGPNSTFINSLRTQAKAALTGLVAGLRTKLTDSFRGEVYGNGTTYTRADLGVYNVSNFAANDNTLTDCATTIQAALDAAAADGGGVVKLVQSGKGTGKFVIASKLVIPDKVVFEGDLSSVGGKVQLILTGNNKTALEVQGDQTDIHIRNLELLTAGTGNTGICFTGDAADPTQIVTLSNLTINGFDRGISVLALDVSKAWQCSYIQADNITIHNCLYGLYLDAFNSDWHMSMWKIYARSDGYGVYVLNGNTLQMNSCRFMGPFGVGAVCTLGVPNPDFADTCVYVAGAHGTITMIECEQEGFRRSFYNGYADATYPYTFIGNVMGAPWELTETCHATFIGNTLFDDSVQSAGNTKVAAFLNFIDSRDACLDAGTSIGGFSFSGNAKMVLRAGPFGIDVQNRANFGDLKGVDSTDPSLGTTPIIQIGSDTTAKPLVRLGMTASGALTSYYQFLRDSSGFLNIEGNQDIPSRGLRINGPLKLCGTSSVAVSDASRTVTDAVVTNGSPTLTSATASFVAADRGKIVTLSGGSTVPNGTYIIEVINSTTVILSSNVTTTGSGRTLVINGNAVINYEPVSDLLQVSKKGAAVQNIQTSDDVYAVGAIPKQLSNGEQAASLLRENGGNISQSSGSFVLSSATGQFVSGATLGTAPFLVTSTAQVNNLNVEFLQGKTWGAPDPIGSTTRNSGAFTTVAITNRAVFNAAVAGSSVDGNFWNDSTQKAIQTYVDGITQTLSGVIFTSTADATVANSTTETSVIGSGIGTKTLPANFFVAGKTVRIRVKGIFSTTGTPTVNVKAKLGSTLIVETTAIATSGTIANDEFEVEIYLTCRTTGATGTVIGSGKFRYDNSTNAGLHIGMPATSATTIDTTASQVLDITWTWGAASASNTVSGQITSIEVLN